MFQKVKEIYVKYSDVQICIHTHVKFEMHVGNKHSFYLLLHISLAVIRL
jgi:hypothetical protein